MGMSSECVRLALGGEPRGEPITDEQWSNLLEGLKRSREDHIEFLRRKAKMPLPKWALVLNSLLWIVGLEIKYRRCLIQYHGSFSLPVGLTLAKLAKAVKL